MQQLHFFSKKKNAGSKEPAKIEANANRYTFVWKKAIKKNEEKMYPKIHMVIKEIKDFPLKKETLLEDLGKVKVILKNTIEKVFSRTYAKKYFFKFSVNIQESIYNTSPPPHS